MKTFKILFAGALAAGLALSAVSFNALGGAHTSQSNPDSWSGSGSGVWKNSAGEWKLLVQKTDDGFAHWYYMPAES